MNTPFGKQSLGIPDDVFEQQIDEIIAKRATPVAVRRMSRLEALKARADAIEAELRDGSNDDALVDELFEVSEAYHAERLREAFAEAYKDGQAIALGMLSASIREAE